MLIYGSILLWAQNEVTVNSSKRYSVSWLVTKVLFEYKNLFAIKSHFHVRSKIAKVDSSLGYYSSHEICTR